MNRPDSHNRVRNQKTKARRQKRRAERLRREKENREAYINSVLATPTIQRETIRDVFQTKDVRENVIVDDSDFEIINENSDTTSCVIC